MIMSGSSSSSTTVNPPTPSLSSLASFTPPSSEFIYVNGNMTTLPLTVSSHDSVQVSLTSITQHVSLEEALMRVSDLMRENAELKAVLQQNNVAMKEQCHVLSSVKHQWAAEREEMKHKFEQTRNVILDLRWNVEDKEAKLIDLEGQLSHRSDEFIVTKEESPSLSAQMNSLRHRREVAEKQAELHSAQNKFLQKQTEKLNDKIAELIEAKSNMDSERVRLVQDNEKLSRECDELKKLTVKQQETQERLVKEKQELLTANTTLSEHISELTERVEEQRKSNDVLLDRYVLDPGGGVKNVGEKDETTSEALSQQTQDVKGRAIANPGGEDWDQLAGLTTELDEEKRKITRLQTRLSEQNTLVQTLQQEIHDKDILLAASREEVMKSVERLTKTHLHEIEDLKSQLKLHPNYNEDVMALRAQVTSLVAELQGSEQRLKDTNDHIERYKHSCTELQARIIVQEAEVSRQRIREDQLTQDLRAKISSIETALLQEKEDKESKEVSLQKLRLTFDQLCTDYHELLSKHEDCKQKTQPVAVTLAHQKEFQEQIDNLTAQIISAEEALVQKDMEIENLQEELREAREEVIPLLKAQAEVYMSDFKAEREAREKTHSQYEHIKTELEDLYEQNYTMEQQINALSAEGVRDIMTRHAILEEDEQDVETMDSEHDPPSVGLTGEDPTPSTRLPTDEQPMVDFKCPMCKEICPDYDSLTIHVAVCLDKVQGHV